MPAHDTADGTVCDAAAGTPRIFVLAARVLPAGILGQFLLAGLALFWEGGSRAGHALLGSVLILILPVGVLLVSALVVRGLHRLRWWGTVVASLYAAQVALGAGGMPAALPLHPLNGALLLTASLVLLAKIERRAGAAATGRHGAVGQVPQASLPHGPPLGDSLVDAGQRPA